MKRKIVNILMWIPLLGLLVGVTQIGTKNSWFKRNTPRLVMIDSIWLGVSGGIILRYGFSIQF